MAWTLLLFLTVLAVGWIRRAPSEDIADWIDANRDQRGL
jgi:hypothetical protein